MKPVPETEQKKAKELQCAIEHSGKYKTIPFVILSILFDNSIVCSYDDDPLFNKLWGSGNEPDEDSLAAIIWYKHGFRIPRKAFSKQLRDLETTFAADTPLSRATGITISTDKRAYVLKTLFNRTDIQAIQDCLKQSEYSHHAIENYSGIMKKLEEYQKSFSIGEQKKVSMYRYVTQYMDNVDNREESFKRELLLAERIAGFIKNRHIFSAKVTLPSQEPFNSRYGDCYLPTDLVVSGGHYFVLAIPMTTFPESVCGIKPCLLSLRDIETIEEEKLDVLAPYPAAQIKVSLVELAEEFRRDFDLQKYLQWHPVLRTTEMLDTKMATFRITGESQGKNDARVEEALLELSSMYRREFTFEWEQKSPRDGLFYSWRINEEIELEREFTFGFALRYADCLKLTAVGENASRVQSEFAERIGDALRRYQ